MASGSEPELSIAWTPRRPSRDRHAARHFIGVHQDSNKATLRGALVRVWGSADEAVPELLACTQLHDRRLLPEPGPQSSPATMPGAMPGERVAPAARLSEGEAGELVADLVVPLVARLGNDTSSLRAIGVLDVGAWIDEGPRDRWFVPHCDTAVVARMTGLTVVDHFPARDLAHRGRGGPLEAMGLWMMLADQGIVPGRRIRAFLEFDETVRLFLLPPRYPVPSPLPLMQLELGPGFRLFDGVVRELTGVRGIGAGFEDDRGTLAVQGRHVPELLAAWQALSAEEGAGESAGEWRPGGAQPDRELAVFRDWSQGRSIRVDDVLCTLVQLVAERVVAALRTRLPRSLPVGQLIVGGRGQRHAFLLHQIQQRLPELEITVLDEFSIPADAWRATAAALLAQLHVDQVPANCPTLTGADTPRLLGRCTPGSPANWHRVLADMAAMLPEKIPLRHAV